MPTLGVDRAIVDAIEEAGDRAVVEPVGGEVIGERLPHHIVAPGPVHLRAARGDDRQFGREQSFEVEIVERGEEHALGKVARRPEQDQCLDLDAHFSPLGYPEPKVEDAPGECNAAYVG